ncbi:hypothetical protein D4764_01G0002070 [Takifugu flavidus]|uniref:Uncharacterized protein n=1 Tax=Takifugu flavidus TaxID=433684 RepID=A0A5C6PKI8_9TELE|nr:hypothetical protein D4764_01G0002070 [Takifugu flavidus]
MSPFVSMLNRQLPTCKRSNANVAASAVRPRRTLASTPAFTGCHQEATLSDPIVQLSLSKVKKSPFPSETGGAGRLCIPGAVFTDSRSLVPSQREFGAFTAGVWCLHSRGLVPSQQGFGAFTAEVWCLHSRGLVPSQQRCQPVMTEQPEVGKDLLLGGDLIFGIAGVTLLFCSVTTFDAVADRLLLPVTCCSSDSVAPGGL